eukprot:gene18604-biopygen18974
MRTCCPPPAGQTPPTSRGWSQSSCNPGRRTASSPALPRPKVGPAVTTSLSAAHAERRGAPCAWTRARPETAHFHPCIASHRSSVQHLAPASTCQGCA